MLDSVERAHLVKPDLILTWHKKFGPKDGVRWRDVDAAIEVRANVRNRDICTRPFLFKLDANVCSCDRNQS